LEQGEGRAKALNYVVGVWGWGSVEALKIDVAPCLVKVVGLVAQSFRAARPEFGRTPKRFFGSPALDMTPERSCGRAFAERCPGRAVVMVCKGKGETREGHVCFQAFTIPFYEGCGCACSHGFFAAP